MCHESGRLVRDLGSCKGFELWKGFEVGTKSLQIPCEMHVVPGQLPSAWLTAWQRGCGRAGRASRAAHTKYCAVGHWHRDGGCHQAPVPAPSRDPGGGATQRVAAGHPSPGVGCGHGPMRHPLQLDCSAARGTGVPPTAVQPQFPKASRGPAVGGAAANHVPPL